MLVTIGPWEILPDNSVERGTMVAYNYGRIFAHTLDFPLAIKAAAKLNPPDLPHIGYTVVELEPTQVLEVEEVEDISDECKSCHTSTSLREGCEPTPVCDNCAQAFYAKMMNPETLRRMSVEVTDGLISRIPDVHAIYAEQILREVMREIKEVLEEKL